MSEHTDSLPEKAPSGALRNVSIQLGEAVIPLKVNGERTEYTLPALDGSPVTITDDDIRRSEAHAERIEQVRRAFDGDSAELDKLKQAVSENMAKVLRNISQHAVKAMETALESIKESAEDLLKSGIPLINEKPPSYWDFPYAEQSPLFTMGYSYLLGRGWVENFPELLERAEAACGSAFKAYCDAVQRVENDYELALAAMADGRIPGEWQRDESGAVSPQSFLPYYPDIEVEFKGESGKIDPYDAMLDGLIDFNMAEDQYYALHILCTLGHAEKLREVLRPEPLEQVKAVASYPVDEMTTNHAFINKAIDGLFEIAHGKKSFELAPKNTRSKSKEKYKLTASEDYCAAYFGGNRGANTEHVKAIMSAVHTMRTDRRAEGYMYKGRIWFQESTIVRELLRTQQGSIEKPRNATTAKRLVHDAITMLSSAQVSGTDASGNTLALEYFMQAAYREKLIVGGRVLEGGFWGFPENATPIEDYSKEIGQSYSYPLLEGDVMSMKNVWIRTYLLDVLNQARAELYTKGGKVNPRKRNTKVKRSWAEIFRKADPLKNGDLPPKTKQRIVSDFEQMLRTLAKMDSTGKLRAGRPMSIKARSERDATKGRGKGEWVNLVIECSSNFRAYKDDDIDLS